MHFTVCRRFVDAQKKQEEALLGTFVTTNRYAMKYNALAIKNWIISAISPMGWSVLIARAMPELLELNQYFSATYVGKNTKWDENEVYVIQWYLRKMYNMEIPEEILWQNGHLKGDYFEMLSFDFFKDSKSAANFKKTLLNIFKL